MKSFLFKHPDIAEKFVRATYRGWQTAILDEEKAMDALQKDYEASGKLMDRKIARLQFAEWKRLFSRDPAGQTGILTEKQFETILRLLKETKMLDEKATLVYEDYFYPMIRPETKKSIEERQSAAAADANDGGCHDGR